jgi:hypothetical protein
MLSVPNNTLVLIISYKTFEFVQFKTVKLIILSYKLKSKVKIAVLSLDAQNYGIVYAVHQVTTYTIKIISYYTVLNILQIQMCFYNLLLRQVCSSAH